jgi:hypothetical protein
MGLPPVLECSLSTVSLAAIDAVAADGMVFLPVGAALES